MKSTVSIYVFPENQKDTLKSLCGRNSKILNVKTGDANSYHWPIDS
jgi:hypothetical protein